MASLAKVGGCTSQAQGTLLNDGTFAELVEALVAPLLNFTSS